MKTFFKTNLIPVFAVLLAAGTMSFKMVEKSESSVYWFNTDGSGNIISYAGTVLPSGCSTDNHEDLCAQSYTEEQTEPSGSGRALKSTTNADDYTSQAFRND